MDMQPTFIQMDQNTQATGSRTKNMVWVKKLGQMAHILKELIKKGRNMEKATLNGAMDQVIQANL